MNNSLSEKRKAKDKKRRRVLALVVLSIAATVIAFFWGNYSFAVKNPGGNDFLVHWVGTRSFIYEGISPYSDATAQKIQNMVYGRQAEGDEHELRVVYPLYSEILFAPFALIENYSIARALWMTFLEVSILATAYVSMRLTGWRPGFWLIPIFLIFSILWYHGMRALINGDAVVLVGLLIVLAIRMIREGNDALAGILLAFTTIKPHLVLFLIVFILLWSITQKRWLLFGWILGGTIALIVFATIFIPNWLIQNIWEILRFPIYYPELSLGSAFEAWWPGVGTQMKWGLSLIFLVMLLFEWTYARSKGFIQFLWTCCLTLVISQWIGIGTDPANFILLFLPIVLVFSIIKERWHRGGDVIVLLVMVVLFFGVWWLFLISVEYGGQPQQNPIMFVPIPLFSLVGLYWIRWWINRPTRYILQNLQS